MWKKIICLANSRKLSGRCIAGKETEGVHKNQWIRPVSNRKEGEVSEEERQFENGEYPQILDILSIKFIRHEINPSWKYQAENYLIDSSVHWQKQGEVEWEDLEGLEDGPDKLWINGYSSNKGKNDHIPEVEAGDIKKSLYLIQPEHLQIIVQKYQSKHQARAEFYFNNCRYNLRVTDPRVEKSFFGKGVGKYPINKAYLCAGLGEPFNGNCYKLVAAVIYTDRV